VRSPFHNPHTRIAAIYGFFREPEKGEKITQINYFNLNIEIKFILNNSNL